jgi:hypothetical protein
LYNYYFIVFITIFDTTFSFVNITVVSVVRIDDNIFKKKIRRRQTVFKEKGSNVVRVLHIALAMQIKSGRISPLPLLINNHVRYFIQCL